IYLGSIFVLTAGIALFRGVGDYGSLPGVLWYPLLHVLSGGVVFGAVFMLTDPVTSPTSAQGRCIFALGAAIITVLIRVKANLPEGCLYSILMMNMLSPMIEKALDGKQLALRKKATIIFTTVFVVGLGSVLLAASAIEAKQPDPKVFISTSDEDVNKFEAKVDEKVDNGDGTTTFKISSQGYASFEDPTIYNKFEIIVNVETATVESLTPTEINDTPYKGDKIDNESFLGQFKGMNLKKDIKVEKNDAVSEATISSKSCVRAVEEVRKALGY
ncbi:MAG: RnfABCDGE type electron transport complex subunit D, partial [Longicatena sp.]